MKWKKYTIATTTEGEELICAMLAEFGITSVELKDHMPLSGEKEGGVFAELQPDLGEDDGIAYVSFYLEEKKPQKETEALLEQIRSEMSAMKAYADLGSCEIIESITDQEDWKNNWKQYFSSFSVDDIFIRPTWEPDAQDRDHRVVIEIDPGMSFGTGKHESTQLCIRQLRKYLRPGDRVLDVGCGSGILSVLALKLGAFGVSGTDIDEDCIASTYENIRQNHLDERLGDFHVGDLTVDEALQQKLQTGNYDIVAANILADIIIPMVPAVVPCMKQGALFVTSGIIDFKEEEVRRALLRAGLSIVEENRQGEWVNITARKV